METVVLLGMFALGGFVIGYAFGLGIHKLDLWERTSRRLGGEDD